MQPRTYEFLITSSQICARAVDTCAHGGAGGWCRQAGECAEEGLGGKPRDTVAALALFRKGCAAGDGEACWFAAGLRLMGDGVERDVEAGLACAERACAVYFGFCEVAALTMELGWFEAEAEGAAEKASRARRAEVLRRRGAERVTSEEGIPDCP